MEVNNKPIMLRDKKAIRLVRKRAKNEHRTFGNALATTVIEALGDPANKNTQNSQISKDKN